ncbi:unnamed product [Ostreococcus tauri]|uniref:Unnamed product n=1 Tax=Ostreococcus tauri TaxID=70448 RepID=A0A090LZG8_OSTTA|nr:unnamed product [Ostreococcus tauri]CEF97370.1 unnamed product [Ostreococcus tauri]|eukprot:XP_003078486.2 unnamed product [Ostreococcus tauri]
MTRDDGGIVDGRESEKIARLTRVVCRLHAACEDHERDKSRAIAAFARDHALFRHEASNAIYRELANRELAEDETRAGLARAAMADAKARCVSEVSREAVGEAREKTSATQREFEAREMSRETAVREKLANMKAACEREREATERAREEALRAETEARRRIVADARATEESLKDELRFERAERARLKDEFARELEGARKESETAIAKVNDDARAIVERAEERALAKEEELERFKAQCKDDIARERAVAREKSERERCSYMFIEKSLAETESELECVRRAHEACRRSLDEAFEGASAREKVILELQATLSEKEALVLSTSVEINRLVDVEAELSQKLSEAQHAYASSMEERVRLQETIDTEKVTKCMMEDQHAANVRKLDQTIQNIRDEAIRCQSEAECAARDGEEKFERLLSEFEERNRKAEIEAQELIASYESRIKATEVEHSAVLTHAKSEFNERVKAAEDDQAHALESVEYGWLQEKQRWEDDKRRLESELECSHLRSKEVTSTLEAYAARERKLVADIERAKSDFEAKEAALVNDLRESKLALHAVEGMAHRLEQQLSDQEISHESERLGAEKRSRADFQRLGALWEQKTRENVAVALEESQRAHESAMDRLAKEMDSKSKGEIARAVANVSEAYHANERELREEIEALNREHAEGAKTVSMKYESELGDVRAECNERLQVMSAAHVSEIERLSSSHAERIALMQSEHEIHLKQSMSEAVRLATEEIKTHYEAREGDAAVKSENIRVRELKRVSEQYSKELEQLEREYAAKLESCIAVSATLELERESLRSQLHRARQELGVSEAERVAENERFRDAATASVYAHESDIETLRKEHKDVIARMQDVNETASRVANEALSAANAEISKWRAMYETRESRPEDVQRIKQLEIDLSDAGERLERSSAHRRKLQTELLGRANDVDWTPKAGVRRSRRGLVT